ncbi:MAG: alpha,alpha-trehalose-phosphate synthase (UDP-forming) [Hyphomicrobiaceae bacterium]
MSRLVMASNRVADPSKGSQSGGLAVALGDALREFGGLWFGWDGTINDDAASDRIAIDDSGAYKTATVSLNTEQYSGYYAGMSNNVLWPILHYRLDLARLDASYMGAYRQVNARFATALRRLIEPSDIVWVHDYHLIPLGAELRAHEARNAIGFFLHIPFPPPDMLSALPNADYFIRCLFSYDVIGFQTSSDLGNFQRYIIESGEGEIGENGRVTAFGRTITAKAYPIGIDVDAFREMAFSPEAARIIDQLQRKTTETVHVIGVDRLDYTKGLPERFIAFEKLLTAYPENRKRLTLMQIAPPTREDIDAYSDIREQLEQLSGAINGRYADFDWTPIRYIHRSIQRATLAALFRGSRIGLVTPLRDGMNLVAKEYIAAQDDDDPGVLILSQFAGAAEDLQDALLVNPYDTAEVAEALEMAATMSLDDRRVRQQALLARVKEHDVKSWRYAFINDLRSAQQHWN